MKKFSGKSQVKSFTRRTKSGKTVRVKAHIRGSMLSKALIQGSSAKAINKLLTPTVTFSNTNLFGVKKK